MTTTTVTFENLGSLITVGGRCIGHLMDFREHGVWEPDMGKVDIAPEYVKPHNDALDAALIEGLDNRCEVGQGTFFYLGKRNGKPIVKTFTGVLVSDDVKTSGRQITFVRGSKTFRGTLSAGDGESFNFRRIK